MRRSKAKPPAALLEHMLNEASWLLSHAEALTDYGRAQEAAAELERAAQCEEEVACLLDAAGQEREAAIHRVSGASCRERVGEHVRAVTLLRAALSAPLTEEHRARVEKLLVHCLALASKALSRSAAHKPSKKAPAAS
jgi:hypothetical protein